MTAAALCAVLALGVGFQLGRWWEGASADALAEHARRSWLKVEELRALLVQVEELRALVMRQGDTIRAQRAELRTWRAGFKPDGR